MNTNYYNKQGVTDKNIMKRIDVFRLTFILYMSLFSMTPLLSQDVVSIDYLMSMPHNQVDVYKVDKTDIKLVYIPFDFSASQIENEDLLDSLLSGELPIERIDFIYTRFKVSEAFDQEQLNRSRLELLRKHAAFIFDNNLIEWNFFEQVNNLNLEENKKLFHGFVIHYLQHPTYAGNNGGLSTEEEINAIEAYLKKVIIPSSGSSVEEIIKRPQEYYPILKSKQTKGIRYSKQIFGTWRKAAPITYDTIWTDLRTAGFYSPFCNDTVVIKTLRNYEEKWNCNYLIEDVTGSMYPYIAQTLAWKKMKLDSSILEYFVFFNDGDHHPDGPIGKSGGAYYTQSHDFEEIGSNIKEVMLKGGGGGAPENNIEALLYAETKFNESDSYILIADNNAPIRDLAILKDIKKPVHIILCGVRNGRIHHSYINLAIQTGGSLHTIEEDIDDVNKLNPGDIFEMGGQKWKFISVGSIVLVKE